MLARTHGSIVPLLALLCLSCGPVGDDSSSAPAFLEVGSDVLSFAADEDVRTLLVKNTGGRGLTYSITVTAESGGVVWLHADPDSGVVEGGSAASVLVRVVDRDLLPPGIYSGELTVSAEGSDSVKVSISMTVGQPVLEVDPKDVLEFGASTETRNLIIKNTGEGKLLYSVLLPGNWLTTTEVLQTGVPAVIS